MFTPARITCVIGLGLAGFIGCARPEPQPPEVDHNTLTDFAFQAHLNESTLVTNDEALRAMLMLADGEDTSKSFEERRDKLTERGILKPAWELHPNAYADYGTVAFMTCRICEISGGVNMHLFGKSGLGDRRYALRELVYREMTDEAVPYQYITGPALFALVRNADALMEEKGLYEPSGIELSDETDRDELGNLIVPGTPRIGPPPEDASEDPTGG